jgi:hypothetical protein
MLSQAATRKQLSFTDESSDPCGRFLMTLRMEIKVTFYYFVSFRFFASDFIREFHASQTATRKQLVFAEEQHQFCGRREQRFAHRLCHQLPISDFNHNGHGSQ